jgi:hypothetical protein
MSRRGIKWGVAKPEWVDGIRFASKSEGRRYRELKLRERAGEIACLELQPEFPIEVLNPANGEAILCGVYRADFRYRQKEIDEGGFSGRWRLVIEDVKGMRTPIYKLKKKLVEALYGIRIVEV